LAILDAAPYGFQLPLRGGAGLLELGECFGQIVVAHVPLGGEAQVAAPFLLDLGRLLEPRVCLPVWVPARPGAFLLYEFL
jgi:hypothetical protein